MELNGGSGRKGKRAREKKEVEGREDTPTAVKRKRCITDPARDEYAEAPGSEALCGSALLPLSLRAILIIFKKQILYQPKHTTTGAE